MLLEQVWVFSDCDGEDGPWAVVAESEAQARNKMGFQSPDYVLIGHGDSVNLNQWVLDNFRTH